MIHSAPKIVPLTVDLHQNLVKVPSPLLLTTYPVNATAADFGREHRAKAVPPEAHGLVANVDASFVQKILDVAKRQWKPAVHQHRQADDLGAGLEVAKGERSVMMEAIRHLSGPQAKFF